VLCESNSRVRISLMSVFIFAILPTGPNKISLQHLTVRNPHMVLTENVFFRDKQ
jgi:hypothetical protein